MHQKVGAMVDYEVVRAEGDTALDEAHTVRRAVFIDEQGVPENVEMDDKDRESTHFVVYDRDGGHAVGTARLRPVDGDTAKIERVAILPAHRGNGLGARLMERAEDEARASHFAHIHLHAQAAVEEFYQQLGYETVSEEFEQAGITHVEMSKEL